MAGEERIDLKLILPITSPEQSMDNPKKSIVPSISLILMGTITGLLIAEVALRLFFADRFDKYKLRAIQEITSVKDIAVPSANPEIHFELKPNLRTEFHESLVVTDGHGRRVADKPRRVSQNAVRIAVLGDSTSFGWRVNYVDTYADRFRNIMEDKAGSPIDLINFSVPNYNAKQELHVFREKIIPFKPSLLILHHDHNDAQPTGWGLPADYLPPEYGENPLHSALLKFLIRQSVSLSIKYRLRDREDKHEYVSGYVVSGPLYADQMEARAELITEATNLNIPVVVVIFIANASADPEYERNSTYLSLHKGLAKRLTDMGYYVLDLYPLYQRKMQAEGWSSFDHWHISKIPPIDAHPNPEGHRFIADALATFVLGSPQLVEIFRTD